MNDRINVDTRVGYDAWSEIYDDEDNPLVLAEESVVRGWIPKPKGYRVGDVGCGTGRHSLWLAEAGASVDAFDFSDGMMSKARNKLADHGVRMHRHALPDPVPAAEDSFDVTLLALVADHLADLEASFRQLRRVTRADGSIIFTVLHPAMNLLGLTARFADPATGKEVRVKAYEHTYADYVMGVLRAGLGIEEIVERRVDDALVAKTTRAEKYLGWPILLAMKLSKTPCVGPVSNRS